MGGLGGKFIVKKRDFKQSQCSLASRFPKSAVFTCFENFILTPLKKPFAGSKSEYLKNQENWKKYVFYDFS